MPEKTGLKAFDYSKSNLYILSIRLSTDGFSFFVFNPVSACFIHSCIVELNTDLSYTENLNRVFDKHDFLLCTYKHVYVMVESRRFTLVPLELFEEKDIPQLFNYNFPPKENELISQNILPGNSCVVLYGMNKNVRTFFTDRYANTPHFIAQVSILIEHFSLKSRPFRGNIKQLFAYLHPNRVDLYAFDRGSISLVNSYECNSVPDFSYYILFVWKQLGMDQQRDELHVTGNLTKKGELVDMLRKFVQHVFELTPEPTSNPDAADQLEDVPYDIQALMKQKYRL